MRLAPIIESAFQNIAVQMVDSKLRTTRVFWRAKLRFPPQVVESDLPLAQAVEAYELALSTKGPKE